MSNFPSQSSFQNRFLHFKIQYLPSFNRHFTRQFKNSALREHYGHSPDRLSLRAHIICPVILFKRNMVKLSRCLNYCYASQSSFQVGHQHSSTRPMFTNRPSVQTRHNKHQCPENELTTAWKMQYLGKQKTQKKCPKSKKKVE